MKPIKLEWDEIEAVAGRAFNVWVDGFERQWAKKMWTILEERGLTTYEDDFEWHRAVFRLLVLGGVYRDFCAVAWDEHTDRWYWDWVDSVEINPLIVGQMYGRQTTEEYDSDLNSCLPVVVEEERSEVVAALCGALGGDLQFYDSLATSRLEPVDPKDEASEDEHFEHMDPTGPNVNALGWVCDGCCPYLSE